MRRGTTGGRAAASLRAVVWGLLAAAVVGTVAYVEVRPPAARTVTTASKVPLGPVVLDRDREQVFLLEIPADAHPDADEPGAFSLEYRGGPWDSAVPYGRCRIVVKDDRTRLGEWEGLPSGCDWHQPASGATLGWSPSGTPLERPVADTAFRVEFTWVDLPAQPAEVILWWSYVTDVRSEPAG